MAQKKKKIGKGRPPKYVLDDQGREIVGLSYNHTNGMYYATGTTPRHYFKVGYYGGKEEAIRQFYEWKKIKGYSPEELAEQNRRNEIFQKAVELIKEGYFDEQVEARARERIKDDVFVKEELLERAAKILADEHKYNNNYYSFELKNFKDKIEEIISQKAEKMAKERVEKWIRDGEYDEIVLEKYYDLIEYHSVRASKILGIKEIAYLKTNYNPPITWLLAWEIFYCYKNENKYLHPPEMYKAIEQKMYSYLKNKTLDKIKYAEFCEALMEYDVWYAPDPSATEDKHKDSKYYHMKSKELIEAYESIPMIDRLEILKDVFVTLKNAGYNQGDHIIDIINQISKSK